MKLIYKIFTYSIIVILLTSCEQEVSISPKVERTEYGKFYIDSNPTGAKIFIDGKNMEKVTPDTISFLDYGEQSLVLKLKYFKNYETKINVKKDRIENGFFNFFDLPNIYGNFTISSNEKDVKVFVNDIFRGLSPVLMQNQIPGIYKIKLEKEGFITKYDSLEIYSGQIKKEIFPIIDTSLFVRYSDLGNDMKYIYAMGTTINEEVFFFRSLFEGYYKLENNLMKAFDKNELFVSEKKIVNEFYIDKSGITKAFTNSGIYNYINNKWLEDFYLNSIVGTRKVNKYIELDNSNILIGTEDGLVIIENGIAKEFNNQNSILTAKSIDDLYVNGDGSIYISTNMTNEVFIYKDKHLKFWNNIDVKKFYKKNENEFFILTNQIQNLEGTDVIKPEELFVYNSEGQIARYTHYYFNLTKWYKINNIKIDPKKNFWFATNYGVIVLDQNFNYKKKYYSTDFSKIDLNVSDLLSCFPHQKTKS